MARRRRPDSMGRNGNHARRRAGAWGVEEFHLPDFAILLQRNDDGKWINMMRAIEGDNSQRPRE